ncbi:unnamed protein product [Microthlaspi erraticum]|uniref:Arabidopsis retrotransposon Orf1 C-terminal domain-containing protein n=1 Tax=Microthlaspi erraticum TaxID=1685480 RepID=A0A6D2JYC8_9BRAS|nr:unnamed protein product [Microthlaspi erraticum]
MTHSSESEQGEFEIGVNLVQEEGNGSPTRGSDETESEEEGEEVNQLVDESEQEGNQDEPWRRLSHKRRKRTPHVKAAQIRSPVLEICPQGSCQHLLCKESHWTINEGEVKLLDMGIKPIISRTRMGRRSEEIGHMQGTHALLEQLSPTRSQPHTNLCAAAGVQLTRRSTPGWMDIKFCKTNLLIEHKELDGRFQFKFTHPLAGPPSFSCPTQSSPLVRGENIDFRPPVYTLVGHEKICEKRSLSSIELRIELRSSP